MKAKSFLILGGVAVVMVALAILTSRERRQAPAQSQLGRPLLAELPVNDIERIVVASADATATLARVDGRWIAPARHAYPVSFSKVRDAVLKLANLKRGQALNLTDAQRAALKLHPPARAAEQPGATGRSVTLYGAGDRVIARLLIGDERKGKAADPMGFGGGFPDGQYLSVDDGASAQLVKTILDDFTTDLKAWFESELLNVQGAELARVTVTHPDGAVLRFVRAAGATGFSLEGLAETEELDSGKLYSTESALSYLRFDDLADPALDAAAAGLDKPVSFEATGTNGLVYTVRVGGKPVGAEGRYARIGVRFDETVIPAPAASADTNAPAATPPDFTAAKVRAAELNAALSPWTFVLAAYKAEDMTVARDQLVKPKGTAEAAAKLDDTPTTADEAAAPADEAQGAQP